MKILTAQEEEVVRQRILRRRVRHKRFKVWGTAVAVVAYLVFGFCFSRSFVARRALDDTPDAARGGAIIMGAFIWPLYVGVDVLAWVGQAARPTPSAE